MPKPPPTSGVTTRNCSSGTWNTILPSSDLMTQPPCVLVRNVQRPSA